MSETFYQIVTDNQWEIIESCLPKTKTTGRPCLNPRTVFNAILFVLESGAKWRYIPKEYGNWNSIYHKFRKWIEAGVFEKILQALIEDCRKYYLLEMDSTFCKVHQDATGAIKKLGSQSIGVSRGGKTTKIHALVNEHFQLIKVLLTGGQVNDSEVAIDLLEGIDLQDKTVLADRAFIAEKIRNYIESNNGNVCIPDKFNSVTKHDFDKELYKSRNIVERFFQRIKKFRHIATRYDKLAVCFLNFVLLAAFLIQF
jgi:transposase